MVTHRTKPVLALSLALLAAAPAMATHVQFSQRPDMQAGTDWLSMHRTFGPVVADDFVVQKPEVVALRWWGSYFSDDPLLGPGQQRPVSFEVSYHPDCPAGAPVSAQCPGDPRGNLGTSAPYAHSTPGQPYQFQAGVMATEVFFGLTAAGERVYEYFADLPVPIATTPGAVAWLDIAWFAGQFGTDPAAAVWGWHESDMHFQDNAVTTDRDAPPPGGNPHLGPWNRLTARDMAFEVITVPEPGSMAMSVLMLAALGTTRARRRGRAGAA